MYLCPFFEHLSHECHLSHWARNRTDDQGWAEDVFVWHNHLVNERLEFVLDPKRKRWNVILRNTRCALLFFGLWTFEGSLNSFCRCLNIGKLQSFESFQLVEYDFIDVSVGYENRYPSLSQWIDVRWILSDYSTRRKHIENRILCLFLDLYVFFQWFETPNGTDLIAIQIDNIFLKVRVKTSLFDKLREVAVPFLIFFRILIGFIFEVFKKFFCDKRLQFGHECSILIRLSWNVQWNILAVDDSFHKSQEVR